MSPQRVLLCAFGSEGDVNPILWAAEALRRRGHEVHLVLTANYAHLAAAAGLPCTQVGGSHDFEALARDRRFWDPTWGPIWVSRAMGASLPVFLEAYRRVPWRPDVVVVTTFGLAVSYAAEAEGLARVHLHLQPVVLRSALDLPLLSHGLQWLQAAPLFVRRFAAGVTGGVINAVLRRTLNDFRSSLGLRRIRDVFREGLMEGNAIGLMVPAWFAPPQPDWPHQLRQFGFPLPEVSEDLPKALRGFLAEGSPPVLWTHGSANYDTCAYWRCAIEASNQCGVRALLVGKEPPADLLEPPHGYVESVPFEAIFPHCSVVAHHAGIGTIAKAISAGVPQLAIPRAHDQADNASRVERHGLGLHLPFPSLTPTRAANALASLLANSDTKNSCLARSGRTGNAANREEFASWVEEAIKAQAP